MFFYRYPCTIELLFILALGIGNRGFAQFSAATVMGAVQDSSKARITGAAPWWCSSSPWSEQGTKPSSLDGCPMFAQAYMGRKDGAQPLPTLLRCGETTAAKRKSPCPRSESIGRIRLRPMVPDFLHEAPPTNACAAFIKEAA
jgi:hypothetical protein